MKPKKKVRTPMKKQVKPNPDEKQSGHWMSREISFYNIKRIAGIFNLEMLHRLSWRSHGVVFAALLAFSCSGLAAEKIPFTLPLPDSAVDKAAGMLKSLDGTVGGKSNYGMAVVFEESELQGSQELWVNFNNKMKLKGFKKLSELEYEDKVRVIFKETKEGKRLMREIQLLQKKQKEGILQSLERKFIREESPQL